MGKKPTYGELEQEVINLTERKQAEEALRESEERYRSLFKNNHSVMLLINPKTADIVDANPAAISYYGWSLEELTCKKITNINMFTEEQVFQEMEKAKKEHRRHFYFQHGLANGDIRDVEVYSGPIHLHGQQLLYSIIHDITDRKQAEEELRESEDLLKATLESTADGILVVDEKGQAIHTNNRFAKMWRIPKDLIKSRDEEELLSYVLDQLKEPKAFLSKVQELYKTSKEDFDTLFFKDGRIFERYSRPLIRAGEINGRMWSFRDVTERSRAQEALRESEEKYKFLAENMVDIVWILDRNFRTTYVSPSIEETLGFTVEERKQQTLEEMITPESLQNVQMKFLEEVQRDEDNVSDPDRAVTIEVEYYRKDGSTVWMENSIKALRDLVGEIVGMHGVSRDIAERKQAEEALRESEERYRYITESSPLGVFQTDKDGNVLYLNNKWLAITDMSLRDALGYGWTQALHPEDRLRLLAEWARCLEEKIGYDDEFRFVRPSGEIRWVHTRTSPVFSTAGDIISHVGVNEDVTERKQAEELLHYSKERYQALSDATFESIFIFEKGICTDANKRATDMFGYEFDELIGTVGTDVIAPESKELVKHNILSGYEETYEAIAQRKDGSTFHAEIRGKMTKYKDKGVRVRVLRDIDDQKRAEEILHKTHDELEHKIRERTAELEKSKSKLIKEIKKHKKTEKKLRKREKELENKTNDLEELNAALKVLLDKRREDKIELQDNLLLNVKTLIEPYVDKLKQYRLQQGQKTLINILESNLNEIVSPFARKLSSKLLNLSPSEIQVANLVKYGKTNKEIAEMLHVTKRTIEFHRENIRKKLGIKNQKTNLKTYLMSLD